jgi:hypothetical protein
MKVTRTVLPPPPPPPPPAPQVVMRLEMTPEEYIFSKALLDHLKHRIPVLSDHSDVGPIITKLHSDYALVQSCDVKTGGYALYEEFDQLFRRFVVQK